MPFQPVGNGAEFVIKGQLLGEEVVTTFPLLGLVGFTQGDLQDYCEAAADAWTTYIKPQLIGSYTFYELVGKGLRTQEDVEATVSFSGGDSGALVGSPMPNNVSLSIARKTGLTGRSNRGRIYWPGFNEADVTNNEISTARAGAIVDALEDFTTAVNSLGTFSLAIITRYSNNALRPTAIARPITSWSVVDRVVDSMRRRLPGRGN